MFFEEFSRFLNEIISLPGILVITGNFNFHIGRPDDRDALHFLDILEEHSLHKVVDERTHEEGA